MNGKGGFFFTHWMVVPFEVEILITNLTKVDTY